MFPFVNPQEIKNDSITSFQDLTDFLTKFDPIKLITQLTLTYLFYPGGEFKPEYDDIHKWSRWIEFICGYLLTIPYRKEKEKLIDGKNLEALEKKIDKYFSSLNKYILSESLHNKNSNEEDLLFHLKIHAIYVRGDTFPTKQLELAKSLYSQYSDYFLKKYGFTISEAIQISQTIKTEYERRINESRIQLKEEARKLTNKQIEDNQELKSKSEDIQLSNFCKLFFGSSDIHLTFSLEDLINFSNFPYSTCNGFLNRLSQEFGYRNPKYPDTFCDPFKAPFDYNTLYERPIIHYDNKYFVPNWALFPIVLLNTFHYDFISDKNYQDYYNDKRGKWLETRTADALKPLFNSGVIKNPQYPNGEELTDIIILYDRKIFIIQCKSKSLTFESKMGQDYDKLKNDIEKGIKLSFEQGVKARNYLLNSKNPELFCSDHIVTIDTEQVTDIFLISITLGYYQSLITRFANINNTLNLFNDNDYPWALSISDFEIITEIIKKPSEFIHYTKQRIKIEKTKFHVSADEIDLLNLYLAQGLNLEKEEFQGYNNVGLDGFSTDVDKYFHDRYELLKDIKPPKREMAEGFENYIDAIEALEVQFKTDCIDKLLLLDKTKQMAFIENVNKLQEQEIAHNKIRAVNLLEADQKFGISFVFIDSKNDLDKLYQQIFSYCMLRKYEQKYDTWVGLGKDISSKKLVELAVYFNFPWSQDSVIERIIKKQRSN